MYNFPRKLNLLSSFRYYHCRYIEHVISSFSTLHGNFCVLARTLLTCRSNWDIEAASRSKNEEPRACVFENASDDWNIIGSHPILDSTSHRHHRNFRYQFRLCRFLAASFEYSFLYCDVSRCGIVLFANNHRIYSQLIL